MRNQRQGAETTVSEVSGEEERNRCVWTEAVSCHGLWNPGEATLAHQRSTALLPSRSSSRQE